MNQDFSLVEAWSFEALAQFTCLSPIGKKYYSIQTGNSTTGKTLLHTWPNNWLQKFIISIESRFLSGRSMVLLKPKHNSRVCHHAYLSCISSFAIPTSLINFTWLSLKACSLGTMGSNQFWSITLIIKHLRFQEIHLFQLYDNWKISSYHTLLNWGLVDKCGLRKKIYTSL